MQYTAVVEVCNKINLIFYDLPWVGIGFLYKYFKFTNCVGSENIVYVLSKMYVHFWQSLLHLPEMIFEALCNLILRDILLELKVLQPSSG